MTATVTALVLVAAFAHALWNALVKSSADAELDTVIVMSAAALLAALILPSLPAPAPASWPYLAASCLLHQGYFALLTAAYRAGDLSLAYPLMRGLAPLVVTLATIVVAADAIPDATVFGIVAISLGVLWIGGGLSLRRYAVHGRAAALAAANALFIAAYTIVDGLGVRLAGDAAAYGLWLFLLMAPPYAVWIAARRGPDLARHARRYWHRGLAGGALSLVSYLIALWAMTQAPIAAVAALRETSVIFAAMLGAWLLREPFGRRRIAGACLVALGVASLRL